jgi:hypothetical protein
MVQLINEQKKSKFLVIFLKMSITKNTQLEDFIVIFGNFFPQHNYEVTCQLVDFIDKKSFGSR